MKQLAVCVSPLQCGKLYHVIKSYADRNVGFKTYHSLFNLYKACVYTFLLPNLTALKMVGCGGKTSSQKLVRCARRRVRSVRKVWAG